MFSHPVSFVTPIDVPNVRPPFIKGRPDSVWVKTPTENEKEIKQAAIRKLDWCYGITVKPEDLTVYAGFEF